MLRLGGVTERHEVGDDPSWLGPARWICAAGEVETPPSSAYRHSHRSVRLLVRAMITQTIVCDVCGAEIPLSTLPLRLVITARYGDHPACSVSGADICGDECAVRLFRTATAQAFKNWNP